jgi:hypothetical protein
MRVDVRKRISGVDDGLPTAAQATIDPRDRCRITCIEMLCPVRVEGVDPKEY